MSDSIHPHGDEDAYTASLSPSTSASTTEQPTADPLEIRNQRLSMLSAAPAQVTTEQPDVHVSLVQPNSLFKTPQVDSEQHPVDPAPTSAPAQHSIWTTASDYFTPTLGNNSTRDPRDTASPETAAQAALSRQSTRSIDSSSTNNPEHFNTDFSLEYRLAATRDSIAAASTQRSAAHGERRDTEHRRLRPRRSLTEHPFYPNQSLAALASQIYPENHHAPFSSRPSERNRPLKAIGSLSAISSSSISEDGEQAQTVGNTPIQTPGLYSPRTLRYPPSAIHSGDGESPIPSPYLHPVQPQAPRETNKAVRDLDSSSGRKTINQYEILYEIGKGTHGKVKLALDSNTGENVAIKIVQRFAKRRRLGKAPEQEDKVKKEIAILKKALHANVVRMIEVIDDPDLHKIYLVLEFCEAHDVKWRRFGESEIIVLESERLKREQSGGTDTDATVEPKRLQRAARRRSRRLQRQHRPPLSRINSESEFWSLEYAEESDPDEDDASAPSISRMTSRQSNSNGGVHSVEAVTPVEHLDAHVNLADNPYDVSSDAVTKEDDAPASSIFDLREFQAEMQRRLEESPQPQNGGLRGRQASVAESASSMISDVVEKTIPEDMRYVPLLTIGEARRAFREALLGIEYLHYQGVIHRDIKPENLLRKADHSVKISDFGVSYLGKPIREGRDSEDNSDAEGSENLEDEADLAKTVGTPAFYAPELCDLGFTEDKPRVTGQIDIWALGVTLYCFLYARLPFQANNEFVMMRRIVTDDIFFSRMRLRAVDQHTQQSRPSSRSSQHMLPKDHRPPHELLYDEIDDELLDLLKRLLAKDPSKRITIQEIKTHPWVLHGLPNIHKWLADTDPNDALQGRKIEISNEEIHEAVAPLRFVERAKSVVKKAIGGLTSFGGGSRKRGQSSAASSEASSSPGPFAPHTLINAQLEHSRAEDHTHSTLKGSREQLHHHGHPEHPLSQSVTASPELKAVGEAGLSQDYQSPAEIPTQSLYGYERPAHPDRQESVMSTATSVRTVRQSDFGNVEQAFAPTTIEQQTVPHDQQTGHFLNILGEAGRSLLRTVRSRDRNAPERRSPSSAPSPGDSSEHLQSQPSVALSSTSASGHLTHGSGSPVVNAARRSSVISKPHGYVQQRREHDAQRRHSALAEIPSFLQLSPSTPVRDVPAPRPPVSSNSSEDHLHPAISRETSFPSIPSTISADSSVGPDFDGQASTISLPKADLKSPSSLPSRSVDSRSSDTPRNPLVLTSQEMPHYNEPEEHPETDEDDSDSGEDFLVMGRTKSRTATTPKVAGRSGSASTVKKRISSDLPPSDGRHGDLPRGRQPPED